MSDNQTTASDRGKGFYDIKKLLPLVFLFLELVLLAGSLAASRDRFTWVLEVFPILLGLPVLLATYKRFQLTNFVYFFLLVHSVILAVGGIYTYAKVPLGFWMQDWFGFARNHYDRIGHFAQGFIPALLAREILLRTSPLKKGKWLTFLVIAVCMFVSAMYELIEFWYTIGIGASAESFLGTQGDVWDAQWDMSLALFGSIVSLLLLSGLHDRFLRRKGVES